LRDWNPLSPLWLYFIPLTLAVVLLGPLSVTILGVLTVLIALLGLAAAVTSSWMFLIFVSAVIINLLLWHRWKDDKDLQAFQFQKAQEELDMNLNDTRISHEKVKVALQANQVKIQRYTALNELARSLAMTFKTQEVVVLLIETISKTFMVPGGVYTLLLFDSPVGKALHSVRYSVDTEMEVRLNRERLN